MKPKKWIEVGRYSNLPASMLNMKIKTSDDEIGVVQSVIDINNSQADRKVLAVVIVKKIKLPVVREVVAYRGD